MEEGWRVSKLINKKNKITGVDDKKSKVIRGKDYRNERKKERTVEWRGTKRKKQGKKLR